jgi:hypothetical protein
MNESWGQRNKPYRTLPPWFAGDSPGTVENWFEELKRRVPPK